MEVEAAGGFVDGVDEHCSQSDDFSGGFDAGQGVEEQRFAQSLALLGFIDCQPGQQHYADRMVGEALGDAARALLLVNRGGGERVVADDAVGVGDHVGVGGVGLLVGPGELLQPFGEVGFGATKCVEIGAPGGLR